MFVENCFNLHVSGWDSDSACQSGGTDKQYNDNVMEIGGRYEKIIVDQETYNDDGTIRPSYYYDKTHW